MYSSENVMSLVKEYQTIFNENNIESKDAIIDVLVRECEWSSPAAEHLHRLVKNNGVFMLRNALALSITLHVEDGNYGY